MHDQSDETQLWSKMQSSFRLESHSCLPHFPIVSLTARFAFTMHTQPLCGQQNRVAAAWKGQHACQSSCAGPRAVHSGWKTPREAASSCCQPPAASLRRSTAACAGGSSKAAAQTTPEREIYPYGGNFGAARRWGEKGRWRCRRRQRGPTSPAGPHDALLLQDEGGAVHQAGHHGHAQAQRHGGGAGPRPGPGALRCPLGRHPHRPRRRLLLLAPPLRPPGPPGTGTARRGAGCGGGPAPKLGRGMGKSGAVTAAR